MADEIELLRLVSELIPEPTTEAWAGAEAAIAAARDEEDRLRRAPGNRRRAAAVTRRVARRPGRGMALRPMATVSAALAACAVILVAVLVPGASQPAAPGAGNNGSQGPLVDAAYVTKHAESALSAAGPGALAQMTITMGGPGGTRTAEEWSYGDRWRSVVRAPGGQPVYDAGRSPSSVYTLVSYPARTWARQRGVGGPTAPAPAPRGCGHVVTALPLLFGPALLDAGSSTASTVTVADALRAAISCGTLTMAGRQRVDGIDAIALTSRPGSPIAETIWVSPGTYLPVRVVVSSAPGTPVFQRTADITWLKPNAQNLAQLTVPIPAGFRQVPLGPTVTPLSP